MRRVMLLCCALLIMASIVAAEPGRPTAQENIKTVNHAFAPGEKLTYSISWSTIIEAGISVMEVQQGKTINGRPTYNLISNTRSVGVVDLFFPVKDSVESIVDADDLYSLSFHLCESHGKKQRQRSMTYDRASGTVQVIVNNGAPETYCVPDRIQDALSSLYYLRTRQDFTTGKTIVENVHDGDKTWAVEVHVMDKERIKTPAGEFDTIKVRTYPKYEGVFMHKGEIYIWLTDDARKIPVLMKSEISIGSIVATLTNMQGGNSKP